jgi:L-2-hydroxyglutarate oxidase LhgO
MKQFDPSDFLVIGSGIIGLSIEIALLESRPNLKVSIFEKESSFGLHAYGLYENRSNFHPKKENSSSVFHLSQQTYTNIYWL